MLTFGRSTAFRVFAPAVLTLAACEGADRFQSPHLPLAAMVPLPLLAHASPDRLAARAARQFVASQCTQSLTVMTFNVQSGCQIDQRITQAPGILSFPCGGGPASAIFGASTFTGSVRSGVANLTLRTAFTFTDGCQWQTLQRVFGSIPSRQLSYSYLESPLPGQRGCARPCGASAMVLVQ